MRTGILNGDSILGKLVGETVTPAQPLASRELVEAERIVEGSVAESFVGECKSEWLLSQGEQMCRRFETNGKCELGKSMNSSVSLILLHGSRSLKWP